VTALDDEIDVNFEKFYAEWTTQAQDNWATLHGQQELKESYRRLSAFQTIKQQLIVPHSSESAASIFHEAHNDALTSHLLASFGAWRISLKSLRAVIEASLNSLYFREHPVELELWMSGKYRTSFSELLAYFEKHPRISEAPTTISGISTLKGEYATLSKAVHGSNTKFWMTDPISSVLLWSDSTVKLSQWRTRESKVLEAIACVVICLFKEKLTGTNLPQVRQMLGYLVSPAHRAEIKKELKVSI
jgi:hypothetical protein